MPPEPLLPAPHRRPAWLFALPLSALLLVLVTLYAGFVAIERHKQSAVATSNTATVTVSTAPDLPNGFPTKIPVEASRLTESYTLSYHDRGAVQSSVSFLSASTSQALAGLYATALVAAGYTVEQQKEATSTTDLMKGSKNGEEMDVVVSAHPAGTLVQLTDLVRS